MSVALGRSILKPYLRPIVDAFQKTLGEGGWSKEWGPNEIRTVIDLPLLIDRYGRTGPNATLVRASGATVKDHEGNIRTLLNDEIGFVGARRVENYTPQSFDDAAWTKLRSTVVDNGDGSFRLTATSADGVCRQDIALAVSAVRFSIDIKRVTGTGDVRINDGLGATHTVREITTEWKRYANNLSTIAASARFGLSLLVSGDAVDIRLALSEDVTDQANQAPSEFILPNDSCCSERDIPVRCFDTTNGNTVDAEGVVTEAPGVPLTTLERAQVWEESTNVLGWANDLTEWSPNNGCVVVDYQTLSFDNVNNSQVFSLNGGGTDAVDNTYSIEARSDNAGDAFRFRGGGIYSADIPVTTEWARYTATIVPNSGTVYISNGTGTTARTMQFRKIQVEIKSYATPFIPTNGTAMTRLADDMQTKWPEGVVNDFVLGCDVVRGVNNVHYLDANSSSTSRVRLITSLPTRVQASKSVSAGTFTSNNDFHVQGVREKVRLRLSSTQGLDSWVDENKGVTITNTDPMPIAPQIIKLGIRQDSLAGWLNGTIGNITLRLGDLSDDQVNRIPKATLFSDTFTDANGVLLQNHIPEIDVNGGGWTVPNGTCDIQGNKLRFSTNRADAIVDVGATDAHLETTMKQQVGKTGSLAVFIRRQDINNSVYVDIVGTNELRIIKQEANAFLVVASAPLTFTNNVDYKISFTCKGDTITVKANDSAEISYTSTFLNDSTIKGFRTDGATSGVEADNLSITNLGI